MAGLKITFPARYKGPFDEVKARVDFSTFLTNRGTGLTIASLVGDANWVILDDPDSFPLQWGGGTPGRVDPAAVRVLAPYDPFVVTTTALMLNATYVDLVVSGGELGQTYLVTVGVVLSNGEEIFRSAAISIAQL